MAAQLPRARARVAEALADAGETPRMPPDALTYGASTLFALLPPEA